MISPGSAIGSSTMGLSSPGAGNNISSSTALLTSIAILVTSDYISKIKIRYTNLGDWIKTITLVYEKALKQTMIDKKIDEKEALQLKKIYNQYRDKRKEIMKTIIFKVDDVFGDVISKDNFSQEQITILKNFSAKVLWMLILLWR